MTDEPAKPVEVINFTQLGRIAGVGVTRAAIFMGLGANAASRPDFHDYEPGKLPVLPGQTSVPVNIVPPNLPIEDVAKFKAEFATWIITCGLREILEHYATMLDHVHRYALRVWQVNDCLGETDPEIEHNRFRRMGVDRKLEALRKGFAITLVDESNVVRLYQARNCLTHDHGVVTPARCDGGNELVLTWVGFDMFLTEPGGTPEHVMLTRGRGYREPPEVTGNWAIRKKHFPVGSRVVIGSHDLSEICAYFLLAVIPNILESFTAFTMVHGIPDVPQPVLDPVESDPDVP